MKKLPLVSVIINTFNGEKFLMKSILSATKQTYKNFELIIIDDGSHILSHQLKALNAFFKLVKRGGYYVIEDYKFPEYFKHLNDVSELSIGEMIKNIKKNKSFKTNLLIKDTFDLLKKNSLNISEHKGYKDISDIMFIEKLN